LIKIILILAKIILKCYYKCSIKSILSPNILEKKAKNTEELHVNTLKKIHINIEEIKKE
jgi:hypothetical protein